MIGERRGRRSLISLGEAESKEPALVAMLLHSLIDGPVDVDKMDYLTRDPISEGTVHGKGIDVQRLLDTMTIVDLPLVTEGPFRWE